MAANPRQVRRLLGGDIPTAAVDGLDEKIAELEVAIAEVEAGDVTVVDGGTP